MTRIRGAFVPRGGSSSSHAEALSRSLGRDLLHLFVEEVSVIIERVTHHLMGKLVHQLVMEKLVHHHQLLLIFMSSKKM